MNTEIRNHTFLGDVQARAQQRTPASLSPSLHLSPFLPPPAFYLQLVWETGFRTAPPSPNHEPLLTSLILGQTGNGDCTSSKGVTSGKSQLMVTFQILVHYRKDGRDCPLVLRLPQCLWKTETSTSSKVPALSQRLIERLIERRWVGGGPA